MAFRNYILCFALVAGTIAGPINVQDGDTKCAKTCEDTGKFKYTPGNTYVYNYEGTTMTQLQGSSEQTTSLKIQATADIEVISQCEFALKLSGVSLHENGQTSTSSNEFKNKLEAMPLRFAFQDGKIESVCSESGEDERVLNIKRGVLSTFQNSMQQLDQEGLFTETDVSGTCPTTYTTKTGVFGGITVTKSKDILACVDRNGNISSIHSERYNVPSKLQNAPLLSSTHQCEQDIKSGQIEKTTCDEVLMFRPFSKDGSGAVTKASQTLRYSTYKRSVSSSETAVQKRSSMLFHHVYDESIDVNAKSDVIALLQEICTETNEGIQSTAPGKFGDLIAKMQRLDTSNMNQVYTAVNGGRICSNMRGKQFFYDAVPMVATEASMALTKKLIADKIVQGTEAEMWLTQLAFIPRPTIAMLSAVKPLLTDVSHRTKALLGISAMVHKICDDTPNCGSQPEIADFISILNSNIGSDCSSSTPEERELIHVTLKALGNAGDAVTSSAVIGRCITNQNLDTERRVIALQAFRRVPCSVSREDAMRLYQNAAHDSELRIHAFLAVMSCPTTEVLTKVRMMLSGEPVNQVGSFVWTYLENLKETDSPLKQDLSTILDDAKLREDFNCDVRKFSRNIEKSFFSDYLNAGAQIESNLIWSQKSYIPRSAMLNVTTQMFGNSINLVEFGGRVQGLEKIVEKFFGPNGYFSQKNAKQLMDNKRQTANYISTFDNVFKTPEDKMSTSMYIKVFGNEIRYNELDSSEWSDLQSFNALDFLIKLAEPKRIDVTKNYQFIDSSLIIPTIVGLPMNLTVNGTASLSVDVNGNIDLRNIATSPRHFDVSGHIKPSAAVIVAGMMGVDAIVTKSSMKVVATMHSSTQIDGKITLKDGEVFNVELNTPQEKMEIFHVKTEFFINGQEMTMPEPAKIYKKCTPAGMTKVIGMEMCVDVSLPTFHQTGLPLPPFTGPMNAAVFVEKKDTHTGYTFTAKYQNERSSSAGATYNKRTLHLNIDTPGSQIDRKMLIEGIYDPVNMAASATLLSPWQKFDWSTSLTNTITNKRALFSMSIDGAQNYTADANLDILEKAVKTTWTPSLTITVPNKPKMMVTGTFVSGTGKVVAAANLNIKNFTRKPITLVSSLNKVKGGSSYKLDMDLKSDALTSSIDSTIAISTGSYNGQASVTYTLQGRPTHRFSASGKFSDASRGDLLDYSLQAGFIPTEFPQYAFNFDSKLQKTSSHIDASLDVEVNKEKISLAHKTTNQGTITAMKLSSTSSFQYPAKSIDVSTTVNHEHNADLIKTGWSGTYNGQSVSANINMDKSTTDKYIGEAGLSYPGRTMSFETDVTKMADGEHKMTMSSQWAEDSDSKMSATASYKAGDMHELSTDIKIPGHPMTISASVKPDLMDFMARTDVTYKRNTYSMQSEYKLQSNSISSSGSLVIPQRTMNYEMSASNQNGRVSASTELKWDAANDSNKKVAITATYNNKDVTSSVNRDASLSVTTPFGTDTFSGEFEKTGSTFGRTELEFVHGTERSKVSGRYSTGTGEFSVESPYIQVGPVKAINGRFNHADGHVDGELTWAPTKTITADAKWEPAKYSIEMTTPFDFNRMGASIEIPKTGRWSGRSYWKQQEATISMSQPSLARGDFAVAYPGHTATGSFSQTGDLIKFSGDAEFNYDTQKYSAKVDFNRQADPITISAEVNTPLKYKKIALDINHRGPLMDFINRASLSWDDEKIRTNLAFNPMDTKVVVKSPWKDINVNYKITGDKQNFQAEGMAKWAQDQQVSGQMSVDMTNGISMTGSFNAPRSLTGTMSVTHTGGFESWNNRAEVTFNNGAPIAIYSEYKQAQTQGKFGVSGLTFEKFQAGEVTVDMNLDTTKSNAVSTVSWNGDKTIRSQVMYSTENGYSFKASLSSPYTETYTAQMTMTGTLTNFNNEMTVQWAPTKKITVTAELSDRSGYNGKIEVDSPWKQMSVTANQRGTLQEFNLDTTMSWETGKQITTSFEFSQINTITAKWSMQTPWEQARDMSVVLTHKGTTADYFTTQLEGKYLNQPANVKFTWDMRNKAEVQLVTVNPWKNMDANMKFTGQPTDFKTNAELTMNGENYSTDLEFAFSNALTLVFNIKPVMIEPVSVTVRADGETNTASVTWGDNQTISARFNYNLNKAANSLTGDASFTTPFAGYESGEGSMSFTGTLEAWRHTMEASFKGETAKLVTNFTTFGQIKGDMKLQTPWYNADGSFDHTGNMQNFNYNAQLTYAQDKTARASAKWDMRSGINAELDINAPFKSVNGKYRYQPGTTHTLSSEMTMDGEQIYLTEASMMQTTSNVNMEFSFTCPIKSFSGKYTHRGTMKSGCDATAEFTWDKTNKMSAEWNVSLVNGFTTEFDIKSPWKNFAGEIKHQGTMENFENTLSATYETGKTVKLVTEFTMSPDFMIKTTLSSPFKNANIMYRHSGSADNFQCRLEGAWDTTPVTGNLRWNMLSGYELSFDANTPWKTFDGMFKTNTNMADLSSEASFNWGAQRFSSTMKFNTRTGYAGEANVATPWRNMSSNFKFQGELSNFESDAALSWEAGKSITAEATYRNRVASAKVNTPWRNLSANYRSTGPIENFDSTTDFSWETGKTITLEAKADRRNGLDTEWKVITPWRTMCISAMYDMSYKVAGELSWEAGKTITLEAAADISSGLDSEVKLMTPWRTMTADAKFNKDTFNLNANASWETGKTVGIDITNTMREEHYETSAKFTSPWKNINADVTFDGVPMKFSSTQEFVYGGQTIKMESSLDMVNAMSAESRLEIPSRTVSFKVDQTGDMTNFDGDYEVSWETGKKIASTVTMDRRNGWISKVTVASPWKQIETNAKFTGDMTMFNSEFDFSWETDKKIASTVTMDRRNGWISKVTVDSPWKQMETNAKFTGELTKFTSEFDFSWETGKKMTTTATFDMNPLKGTWSYKCPSYEMSAEFQHNGEMTDFNNSAFFQWEPTKKVEVASSFKMADTIEGQATVKTPFTEHSELSASFKHTPTSGEMSLTTPYTEELKAEYTYSDYYNFNSKLTHGARVYTSEAVTSWNNGVQTEVKYTCPEHTMSMDIDHRGDLTTFTNTLEAKYDGQTYKLVSTSDMDTHTYSQSMETPHQGWEKMEWSANVVLNTDNMRSTFMISRNNQKIEVETSGNVEWKKSSSVFTKTLTVKTPFAGWEDNKVTGNLKYSARKVDLTLGGYKGATSNSKSFRLYSMSTSSDNKRSLESFVKTNIYGTAESKVEFAFTLEGERLTGEFTTDLKFAPTYNTEMKLDTTYSRTTSGLNHNGSFEITCSNGLKKVEWNAGSNQNMCETGLKYTNVGQEVFSYTHKTTWTSAYDKMDHEMTFKCGFERFEDCDFKLSYDFTSQAKKTVGLTWFTNPRYPVDFKAEAEMGDNMRAMVELSTPFDDYKLMKSTVEVNKASQPWTVSMESQFNDKTVKTEGRMSYTSPSQLDASMTFTSEIPMFENLQFSVSNNELNGQWKPHMVAQWANDKKIEMSGIFSMSSQYKLNVDVSTPFDSLRSLTTDVTINNQLPEQLRASFDFQTNKMSDKLSAQVAFNKVAKSFSASMSSPFEQIRSFEITGAATPRITAAVKLNGQTYFSVNGNGSFESMYKHDLDVTMTYPFWNKYMRVQVNNDLSMTSVSSQIDLEYMRGKEITSKINFNVVSNLSVVLTTPFEKFEKMSYAVNWSGSPDSWTENTTTEFYYGKITTTTSFSMTNGVTYHQTINGEMKNGWTNFQLQKDLVVSGVMSDFDVTASISGSMVPTMSLETSWKQATNAGSVKLTVSDYYGEYIHTGTLNDFQCNWKLRDSQDELVGTWSFKNTNGVQANVDIKTSDQKNQLKLNIDGTMETGTITGMIKENTRSFNGRSTYSRSSSPYRYSASTKYWVENEGVRTSDDSFETSVDMTMESITYMWKYNGEQVFAVRASNKMNADDEYIPTIVVEITDKKYEFDGLYKNVGSGLIRDFKLHLNGPRGDMDTVDFKFEFRTQSQQLVPGDMKFYLTSTSADREVSKWMDMTATWGNDHALITFVEPAPMRYSLDFSVSTSGQTGTIEANWDTSKADRNWKMMFENKFSSSSKRMVSEVDIDIIYLGVSRGFTSKLDWQTSSISHKLTTDYNGKQMGYEFMSSDASGQSLEVLTPWRNVKTTWNYATLSNGNDINVGLYWDSGRDMDKKFLASSRWETTAVNTYKWTTTFAHPALVKAITLTDTIAYDTDRVYFAFNKVVSFSTDSSKDVTLDLILEKNGKWGVELKQDFNKIDLRLGTEFTQTGTASTVKYRGANGRMKTFGFNTNYNPSDMALTVELRTPVKNIKIETIATRTTYTISATVDGKVYTSAFTLKPEDYYMLIKLSGESSNMEFEAKQLNGGYQIQLAKTEGAKTTVEGRAAISMNENRTISGDLRWNPALISELKSKVASLKAELKDTVKTMSAATSNEANKKMRKMSLGSDFSQIMPQHKSELSLVQQDINAAKLSLQRAYTSDVMFMKSLDEHSQYYYSKAISEMEALRTSITAHYERVIEPMVVRLGETSEQVLLELNSQLEKIEQRLQALRYTTATKWNEQLEIVGQGLGKVADWIQTYTDRIAEYLAAHPTMATLKSIHSTTMDSFNSVTGAAISSVNGITDSQTYANAIYGVHTYANGLISGAGDRYGLSMNYILGLSDSLMYKVKFYYDYYDIPQHVQNFMVHAQNVGAEYLNDYLTHYIDQTLNDFKWVAYDVQNGHIQFEMTIPTRMEDINLMAIKSDLKNRLDIFINHMSQYHWNMREMFYMYRPRVGQILPPFDAQAIIAGQHIRTFDRRHYDFSSGSCSYLLARDFVDGNFTVFVNYNGAEQTITVKSNGKTVDIGQDYTVKMNGGKVELPVEFYNTTITRMGAKVVLTSALGVEVVCDNKHGLCTVEMSGHYFAKTGGLFGTYNYEPLDDWTSSDNQNKTDVTSFANSWASSCTGTNTAKDYTPVEGTKEYTACATLFKDGSSSLAPCFGIVKSEDAFHKCINDMSNDVTLTAKNGPCKAAKFYETECRMAGIEVMEPAQCVACEVGSNSITMGEKIELATPVMAADIVFVVEEKMCNRDIDSKLPALAKQLERSLGKNSFTDMRFGLVGFGGAGVHKPNHVHTMASKMFASRAEFSLGTAELVFSNDETNKDVFSAIDFAAQYPFRAGASKVVIVLPCSDCSSSQLSYRSVAARLNSENINVHVISKFDFEVTVEGKNPASNYLFGIDDSAVYTMRDSRSNRGNSDLYSIVSKPTDRCSTLALSTGGTIFNQNMMTKMRSSTIKSFQTVFANRLATTTYPSKCTACSCEYNYMFGMSRTVCNKC